MIRKKWNEHIVSALKKLPAELTKLRRTIGESVKKDEDPFRRPAMLEKLKRTIAPNSCRRSGSERFNRAHRFLIAKQLLRGIVGKWPSIYREKQEGGQRSYPRHRHHHGSSAKGQPINWPGHDLPANASAPARHTPGACGSQINL